MNATPMKITPLHLSTRIHYYVSPEPWTHPGVLLAVAGVALLTRRARKP